MDVDTNMQQILDFIQNRELRSHESTADQLAQLSSLLKSSTAQHDSKKTELGDGDNLKDAVIVAEKKPNGKLAKAEPNKSASNSTNTSIEKKSKNSNQNSNLKSNLTSKKVPFTKTTKHISKNIKKKVKVVGENKEQKSKNPKKEISAEEFKDNEEKTSIAVKDMQSVRQHLQSMLNIHKVVQKPPLIDESDDNLSFEKLKIVEENNHENNHENNENVDSFDSSNTATLLRANPRTEFISPVKDLTNDLCAESLTSDLFSMIKANKASTPQSAGTSLIDSSMVAQNEILRDTLEKETYRRQHCEKQIQKLQKRILKVQQELAVCHSRDCKKDIMIEQLDITLAKVVDGWKTHEGTLVDRVDELKQDKENNTLEIIKLKEMLVGFESELAQTLEDLILEREKVVHAENNEKKMQSNYQARTEEISEVINQKNVTMHELESKLDDAALQCHELQEKLDDNIREFAENKCRFIEKEEEWEEIIIEMEKNHKQEIEQKKRSIENEEKRCEEMKLNLTSSQEEFVRLQQLLKTQQHDLENLQNEIGVNETKQISSIRKLEAEHKIAIERQVTEKLSKVHLEAQKSEANIREMHKKQVADIMDGHRRELEAQCGRYEEEMRRREELLRRNLEEREKSLNDMMKEKGDDMRQKMMSMMQNLMQAHYQETLQVVGNTTGLTPDIAEENQLTKTLTHDETSVLDFQQANMMASVRSQQGAQLFQPFNTMTSQYPAFESSDMVPRQSLFQPPPNHSVVTSLPQFETIGTTKAFGSHVTTDEEVLPNLSLISSISHSTVSSMPQVYKHVAEPHFTSVPPVMAGHVSSVGLSFQQQRQRNQQADFELPVMTSEVERVDDVKHENTLQSVDAPHDVSDPQLRQNTLQHYVNMLLQRPPNQPVAEQLNTPKQMSGSIENEENQNNPSKDLLSRLLTSQSQASPDLVPTKQKRDLNTRSAFASVATTNSRMPPPNTSPMAKKQTRKPQNVRFAPSVFDQSSNATPTSNQPPVLSHTQMGEISRILGSYASLDTPSGDTKVAAEQLLNYLKDSNAHHVIKMPSATPVTSSPIKRPKRQTNDTSLHVSSLSQSGGHKNSNSASKAPVWR